MKIGFLPDIENDKADEIKSFPKRDPNQMTLSNFPQQSDSIVNTERISTQDKLIYHFEGGWPKEVDITDENDKKKYIKKKLEKNFENQDKFTPAIKSMLEVVERVIS